MIENDLDYLCNYCVPVYGLGGRFSRHFPRSRDKTGREKYFEIENQKSKPLVL